MSHLKHFSEVRPLLLENEIGILESCFLFCDTPREELFTLFDKEGFSLFEFSKGEVIFGKEKNRLGILLSGRASALCDECSRSRLKVFSAGELFGAAGVFLETDVPSISRIEALSACRVLFISRSAVEKMLFENPERAVAYIRFLSGRVEFLNQRIKTFTSREALGRVAEYFLKSSDSHGICLGVNFSALAKTLDISRASLYRARNELIASRAISVDKKAVTVLDRNALENII